MKRKRPGILLIVLLLFSVFLSNIGLLNGRAAPNSVDTAWIESLRLEQTGSFDESAADIEAPQDEGTDAAILAAEILLMPIFDFIHLPLMIR